LTIFGIHFFDIAVKVEQGGNCEDILKIVKRRSTVGYIMFISPNEIIQESKIKVDQIRHLFEEIKNKALPFKLSELLSEKMLIKHTTRANLIFKILFRG
jgi:hypothetical protein